jgi:hypothetical protein
MASTFAAWQSMVSDPNLTRKLASQVIIFEFGMIISGENRRLLTRVHRKLTIFLIGTYFGPKSEYEALGFQDRLAHNATVKVTELEDWLGSVTEWAQGEALKLVGGIVRRWLPYRNTN